MPKRIEVNFASRKCNLFVIFMEFLVLNLFIKQFMYFIHKFYLFNSFPSLRAKKAGISAVSRAIYTCVLFINIHLNFGIFLILLLCGFL